jgi:hypothetical protein
MIVSPYLVPMVASDCDLVVGISPLYHAVWLPPSQIKPLTVCTLCRAPEDHNAISGLLSVMLNSL